METLCEHKNIQNMEKVIVFNLRSCIFWIKYYIYVFIIFVKNSDIFKENMIKNQNIIHK